MLLSAVAGSAAASGAAPTATVGGSTALDAALPAQWGPAALTLSATGVSPGATLAWTIYDPDGVDQTSTLITSPTSATPTWGLFTLLTSGAITGTHVVKLTLTGADGQQTVYTRRVTVGLNGWLIFLWDFSTGAYDGHDMYTDGDIPNQGLDLGMGGGELTAAGQQYVSGGRLTIKSGTGGGKGVGWFSGFTALFGGKVPIGIRAGFAVDANFSSANDGVWTGSAVSIAEIRKEGAQRSQAFYTPSGWSNLDIPGGAQGRQCELRVYGRFMWQALYSTTAWSGVMLADSAWTKCGNLPASGSFGPPTQVVTGTTDAYSMPSSYWNAICPRDNNNRIYTIPAVWIAYQPRYIP